MSARAECLHCHYKDVAEAFHQKAYGAVEYTCPRCKSDDVDVYAEGYFPSHEEAER